MKRRRPHPSSNDPHPTAWSGETARWYDALVGRRGSQQQRLVVFPGALRLLALQPRERLLDLGCGQGAFARLAHQGGARVIGLDASPDLIASARRQSPKGIEFAVGDARRLPHLFPPASFDAVACLLAIQNMDDLDAVLAGCAHVLRPGGRLVLVLTHPCFRIPRQSDWGWDEARKLAYRRMDRYQTPLRIPIQTHPGKDHRVTTWTFHRPLQAYFQALRKAGLLVEALEEWPGGRTSQPGPRARAENRARAEIPLFLALRAISLSPWPLRPSALGQCGTL